MVWLNIGFGGYLLGWRWSLMSANHEHLDYHRTYERYLPAKGKLFKKVKPPSLNKDDKSFAYLNSVRPRVASE